MTRFTAEDLDRANRDWQCSCGPAALAAICDLTLDEVKSHFQPAFPGWTTPTRMFQALRNAGAKWSSIPTSKLSGAAAHLPTWGLARVQWHGPWTSGGAPPRWAYRHTHWIGVSKGQGSRGHQLIDVFDINTVGDELLPDGWGPLEWWTSEIVPLLTRDIPRATGGWHITHAIEVER